MGAAELTGRTGNLLGGCVQTGDWEDWRYLVLDGVKRRKQKQDWMVVTG